MPFVDVSPPAFADSLRKILPPWQVDGLLEDYAHYRRGEAAALSSAITEITGTPPRDVAQFARDYAPALSDSSDPVDLTRITTILARGSSAREERQPAGPSPQARSAPIPGQIIELRSGLPATAP
jgi:hypothetical protein